KRPARAPGMTASNAGYLIPEAIRKKFIDGWRTHVPLQFLTDKYCAFANHVTAKEMNDYFTMDGSTGTIISVAKELPFDRELTLDFDEWFQGWGRLLELILAYVPEEHPLWLIHYESILHRPNRSQHWALCLEYDSQIRRRALNSSIDPSEFHLDIWNELESAHIAKRALAAVQRGLRSSERDESQPTGRGHPYSNSKRPNSDTTNSFRSSNRFRCFVCGDDDKNHRSRSCAAERLVTGKPAILITQTPGGPRKDRAGNTYCFSFNGHSGCTKDADCSRGKHWCTLCGAKGGLHSAQNCTTL
ncbi:hypothetical protein FB451DRAFT_1059947, partial [Mycena latifolia]